MTAQTAAINMVNEAKRPMKETATSFSICNGHVTTDRPSFSLRKRLQRNIIAAAMAEKPKEQIAWPVRVLRAAAAATQ